MKTVYRDTDLKAPKLYLATYMTLTNCFIVSFTDYLNFMEVLSTWTDEHKSHSVIADAKVEPGKLYHVNEDGEIKRYTLKDFEDISSGSVP